MSKKCPHCKRTITDKKAKICPNCDTLVLPDIESEEITVTDKPLTHEHLEKIADMVANRLVENGKFKWKIIRGIVFWAGAILGIFVLIYGTSVHDMEDSLEKSTDARLESLNKETANQIASTESRIEITISNQFADPRIKDLMESVATIQASNLLIQQISPQIGKFNDSVDNTLRVFDNQLNQFEIQSSNAIANVKSTSDFGILVAKANADDYSAFCTLLTIDRNSQFFELAQKAVLAIGDKTSVESLKNYMGPGIVWNKVGINEPDKASLQQYEQAFNSVAFSSSSQKLILESIFENDRFSKHDRIEFAILILTNSPSLLLRSKALALINNEAKITQATLGFSEQLNWWNIHSKDYTNSPPVH